MIVTRRHDHQHYSTVFDTRSGFFARMEDSGYAEPFWSEHGPELMDVAVTNWCDKGCAFCYRKSDTNGVHMLLQDYKLLMRQAAALGVFQVALGGGNPNQHPKFDSMLSFTRLECGIVPSYTTNGRGLTKRILTATSKLCGAVAVSAYPPFEETRQAISVLIDNGIKTNIHFILDEHGVDTAISWLRNPPKWFNGLNAVIFLNYKPVVRTGNSVPLAKNNPRVGEVFRLATSAQLPFKVGFDDCSVTGLITYGDADPRSVEACDSARFSMFVSERMQAYPCSFMTELCEGHKVTSKNLQDIWRHGPLFTKMRESLSPSRCGRCSSGGRCMSGCPLFPEINICDSTLEKTSVRAAMDSKLLPIVTLPPAHGL